MERFKHEGDVPSEEYLTQRRKYVFLDEWLFYLLLLILATFVAFTDGFAFKWFLTWFFVAAGVGVTLVTIGYVHYWDLERRKFGR
jgi:hypothetical protein